MRNQKDNGYKLKFNFNKIMMNIFYLKILYLIEKI